MFASLTPEKRALALKAAAQASHLSPDVLQAVLLADWRVMGRASQQPPEGEWTYWFLRCGRGFGKTLSLAQWAKQVTLEDDPGCRFALVGPTFADVRDTMIEGEALALDTLVQTPSGARPIGDIHTGDLVLGGDGQPCRVIHAHSPLWGRRCYRLKFKGGAEVVADADHRWLTEDYTCRAYTARNRTTRRRPEVVTTEEMLTTLRHFSGAASQANHGIRVAAFDSPAVDLPIDPYVLGAWLGDGLSKGGAICDADGGVIAEVGRAGYTIRVQPSSTTVPVYGVLGLQRQLRLAGLLRNKHVPAVYLRASTEQRLSIVQGLMDTDGSCTVRGQCEYVSKDRGLADALVDLLCGLGIKASSPKAKPTRLGGIHWIVRFTTTAPIFRLERKLARVPATYRDAAHWFVAKIDPTDSVAVRCLTVDSPDRTYLITRHYIRTHNTGLLSVFPPSALLGQSREQAWNRSIGELRLANGTRFRAFSSERPDRLRGPQHHYAWCTEVSSWNDAHKGDTLDTTWSNVKLSTRLGAHPRYGIDSTPKPNKLTKAILAIPGLRLVVGSSYENRDNLSEQWWQEVIAPYEGSRVGLQEIHGQMLEDVEGALWTMALLDSLRVGEAPQLARVVVGVDPNVSSDEAANAAGIIVGGVDGRALLDRRGYVLADRTVTRGGPRAWAQAAVDAYHEFKADKIVAEKNNGGEMVEIMLKTIDPAVPVKLVSAARGKRTRAEPIASLYEGSDTVPPRIFHVGSFPELEAEMCTWTPEAESPDRMDALAWTMSELMLGNVSKPGSSHVPRGRIPTSATGSPDRRPGY